MTELQRYQDDPCGKRASPPELVNVIGNSAASRRTPSVAVCPAPPCPRERLPFQKRGLSPFERLGVAVPAAVWVSRNVAIAPYPKLCHR
jgi:hypothetical protein